MTAACSCQPKGGLPHGEHPYDYGYDDPADCPVHGTEPRFAEIRIDELEAENARIRDALERALHRLTHVDGKVLLAIDDSQVILREALAGDAE